MFNANHTRTFDIRMEGSVNSNEKAEPKTVMANPSASVLNSDSDDLAILALEKRVLRKTDMVVLPMVMIPPVLPSKPRSLTGWWHRCAAFSSFNVRTINIRLFWHS